MVLRLDNRMHSSPGREVSGDLGRHGLARLDNIPQDSIHHILVEDSKVPILSSDKSR
jgi:hypothetical protein